MVEKALLRTFVGMRKLAEYQVKMKQTVRYDSIVELLRIGACADLLVDGHV